ncbi:MAG: DUF1501 domain-containing protein, partial [Gemmataceae bacterium]
MHHHPRSTVPFRCDGPTRRNALRAGALSALGLTLPQLLSARAESPSPRPKNCIILFLLGGPPQHSTWDPKPNAPRDIQGEFGPIATATPGLFIGSLFPELAKRTQHLCFLRAMSTGDNAHSSSGYSMMTGVPHNPLNAEGVRPGPPNDSPTMGAIIRRLRGDAQGMPGAVRLPMQIFNTDGSIWPGQDAGFLGRTADPWLLRCQPAAPDFQIPGLTLRGDVPLERLGERRHLLTQFDASLNRTTTSAPLPLQTQAFELLASPKARQAFQLSDVPDKIRDAYGRTHFGQSCLLARRLIE